MAPSDQLYWTHPAGRRLAPPAWQRMLRQVLVLALGAMLVAIIYTYLKPLLKERDAKLVEESKVLRQLEEMRQLKATEESRLLWLRNNDEYLQIQARDKLDLQAPGETIVRIGQNP